MVEGFGAQSDHHILGSFPPFPLLLIDYLLLAPSSYFLFSVFILVWKDEWKDGRNGVSGGVMDA